jgi:kynurenine formamidase
MSLSGRLWALSLLVIPILGACDREGSGGESVVSAGVPTGTIVDLSHAFDEDTVYWPTAEGFHLKVVAQGDTEGGYYYAANEFSTAEHGGTHIDAPIHFHRDRWTVDTIPLDRLIGPGVVVDVTAACRQDRDHRVTVEDLLGWEDEHGPLPEGAIVLLRTGFGAFWPDRERYMGTSERGEEAVPKLHFPGLHADAAHWLATQRDVRAVGLDTPSIDHGPSTDFASHVTLFGANIPAFENVANLDKLPPRGFSIVALPMKIRGGSGGPLRIVALLP